MFTCRQHFAISQVVSAFRADVREDRRMIPTATKPGNGPGDFNG